MSRTRLAAVLLIAAASRLAHGQLTLSFPPVQTFADVGFSARWYGTTDLMRERNITIGCQATPQALYCPEQQPDRAMAAILIIRSIYAGLTGNPEDFTPPPEPYFADVPPSHWAFRYIQQVRYLGITAGCNDYDFCPATPVSNSMMAIFTVRARRVRDNNGQPVPQGWLPPYNPSPQRFGDIAPGHWLFPWVQSAYDLVGPEIQAPEYGGYFYPDAATPRGQASFYLIYGILGSAALPPNNQGGLPAYVPPAVNGPNCSITGGPYYMNEVYQVTADSYYSYTGTIIDVPGALEVSLWVSGVRTQLQRDGAPMFDSYEVQGQTSATYRYPPSGGVTFSPGNYLQPAVHRAASGACNTKIPSSTHQSTYWPANGQPVYLPPQYYLTTAVSPPGGGTISPAGGWYNSGAVVTVSATANPGFQFSGFTGALTGTTNPQNLTMDGPKSVTAGFVPSGPLTVSCSATPAPASVGELVVFSATVSGGSPPYSYSWSGAVWGSGQSVSFVPGEAGGYQASVTVNQTATASCSTAVADPVLAAFRNCIGANGTGQTCQLAHGTYVAPPPFKDSSGQPRHYLEIGRSGITIKGTMISGPSDTVLRRGRWVAAAGPAPEPATHIMRSSGAFTGVTIRDLMFDGNRYGAGLNCLPGNAPYWDLDLGLGGAFNVQWVEFINAPGTALVLSGNSTVSLSKFGQGGYGIGPALVLGYESPAQTATRSTAVWISGINNGAWYNAISYAGTAGITLDGIGQYAYGNLLYSNRYEISDRSGGGQIFVSPGSRDAYVAGNVIDGGDWPPVNGTWPPPVATFCNIETLDRQYNAGVEGYGQRHWFWNNEIVNHTGSGMQFAGSEPTSQITVSSANPWDASDTPRFIERNGAGGIVFLGPEWCMSSGHQGPCQATSGVTLDAILVRDNGGPSVSLDGVSNNGSYTGFVNGSCISGNHIGNVPADIPRGQNTLTYPFPSSYASYRGGPCPVSAWPQLPVPASSHIPGWPW